MSATKEKWNFILLNETMGFSFLILMAWLTELLKIPHYLFGEAFVPNWKRAVLRTVVLLMIWLWVHTVTKRLLKRLHYLEDFIRMCSWCKKVCCDGEWTTLEKFLDSKYAVRTTHGMCPDCLKDKMREIAAKGAANP